MNCRNNFFYKILLSCFFVLLIPALILCAAMVKQIQDENQARAIQECHDRVILLTKTLDEKFMEMDSMGTRLSFANWVNKAKSDSPIMTRDFDLLKKREISYDLYVYSSTIGVAKSVALALPKKKMIIDSVSWWEDIRYFNSINIRDSATQQKILALLQSQNYFILQPVQSPQENTDNNFILIRKLEYSTPSRASLIFYIDGQELQKYVSSTENDRLLSLQISQENHVVYTSQSGNKVPAKNTYTETISSSYYNWKYVFQIERTTESILNQFTIFAAALLVFLIASCLGAYLLARITYYPFVSLVNKIGVKTQQKENVLTAIERSFQKLHIENQNLQQLSQQYFDDARNNFIINLLWGSFDSEKIQERLNSFQLNLQENMYYQVFLIQYQESASDSSRAVVNLRIQDFLDKYGVSHLLLNVLDSTGTVLICAFLKNTDVADCGIHLPEFIGATSHDKGCTFVGTLEKGFVGISKSYQNAKEKSKRPSSMTALNSPEMQYYYPLDWQMQLINHIKSGNEKVSLRIIRELENENLKRRLTLEENNHVTAMIFETLTRIAEEMELDFANDRAEFARALSSEDPTWSWDFLAGFIEVLCCRIDYFNSEPTIEIGQRILAFVKANCCDSSLSLQVIADQFGISVPSVSKIFKNTFKVNYIDYLHLLRVHRAKEYFDNGETDILFVAQKTGYENESTFKRAFLRIESTTPRKYVNRLTEKKASH